MEVAEGREIKEYLYIRVRTYAARLEYIRYQVRVNRYSTIAEYRL
jgi:hypothetical protein